MNFTWNCKKPKWSGETFKLLTDIEILEIPNTTLSSIIEKSDNFSLTFPVDTGRCKKLQNTVTPEILERNINSVYPFIHENALELYAKFIVYKRKYGSTIEKELYKDMNLKDFIDRLLRKRAVQFMGRFDSYLLLNKKKGSKLWDTIGTVSEKPPLILRDCISYDEIKLSVFLSVSSYTYFINEGDRKNKAIFDSNRGKIEDEGIIVGCIGTRLKKEGFMEYQELVINSKQNKKQNGYDEEKQSMHKLFADLYEEPLMDHEEVFKYKNTLPKNCSRYTEVKTTESLFDNNIYYKRLVFTIDTLLIEANARAKLKDTTAYVHLVGLGLGVWRYSPHQDKTYVDTCVDRIKVLGEQLFSVSDVCFSYINQPKCGGFIHGDIIPIKNHPNNGIKVLIYKREPHTRLKDENQNKLLVVSYAWDGNALPGNEYWNGKLGSSGDSAAASSTQIAELHNTHINDKVCADNLRVVTTKGVVTFKKYQEGVRNDASKRKVEDT